MHEMSASDQCFVQIPQLLMLLSVSCTSLPWPSCTSDMESFKLHFKLIMKINCNDITLPECKWVGHFMLTKIPLSQQMYCGSKSLILSLRYSCYKKAIKPRNYDQTAREMKFTKSTWKFRFKHYPEASKLGWGQGTYTQVVLHMS